MEYNFLKPSKRLLETSKRIDKQTNDYLDNYYKSLKEEEEVAARTRYESAMSAARFSNASSYARSKQRVQNMTESLNYANKTTTIGMTEMISQVVEESLLFDTAEFAQMSPNYKQEIRETVKGLLESGNIIQDINNRNTLLIMEHIARCIPEMKVGMYLSEDEISAYMSREPAISVEAAISKLSGNVKSRVANLVEKEQTRLKKVKEEMPAPKEEDVHAANLNDVPAEEVMDQDQDGMVDQAEMPEDMPPEQEGVIPEEGVPMEGEEEMPVEGEEIPAEEGVPMEGEAGPTPTKQISITPDGTVNVNIFEGSFMRELDEEIECIIDGGLLMEKFNDTKFIDKTIVKDVTYSARRKGNIIGLLFNGIIGALIGRLIGRSLGKHHHKEKIEALEKLVRRDSEAMRIIGEIKDAYDTGDSGRARELKKEFTIRVRDIKKNLKYDISESVSNKPQRIFFRDVPRSGLIESLAVNEAHNMIVEHGIYDRDLAFANALMYVTIMESFGEMGLLNVDDKAYATIVHQAGGRYL